MTTFVSGSEADSMTLIYTDVHPLVLAIYIEASPSGGIRLHEAVSLVQAAVFSHILELNYNYGIYQYSILNKSIMPFFSSIIITRISELKHCTMGLCICHRSHCLPLVFLVVFVYRRRCRRRCVFML